MRIKMVIYINIFVQELRIYPFGGLGKNPQDAVIAGPVPARRQSSRNVSAG